MGLLDILGGISGSGGMRGAPAPGGQGMSPIAKALLGLVAMYAMKSMTGGGASSRPGGGMGGLPGGLGGALGGALGGGGAGGGGLGDLLRGPLGGMLGGAAGGSVLSGGLGSLIDQLQRSGHGAAAQSWVGHGPNDAISEGDLASALGGDTLDALSSQSGMSRQQLLSGLSKELPGFVDRLTPDGRVPTEDEAARMV